MRLPSFSQAGAAVLATVLGLVTITSAAEARPVRNTTRTSVHRGNAGNVNRGSVNRGNVNRGTNVNRGANVNRNYNENINVNRNVNVHRDIDVHDVDDGWYHPVATAVAVGATAAVTAAVVGSIVYSLPPSCTSVTSGGVTYQQCGDTWYRPQYSGTQLSYVVVNPP